MGWSLSSSSILRDLSSIDGLGLGLASGFHAP
jgi:hypothetical protein